MWHETTPEQLFEMTQSNRARQLAEAGSRLRMRVERSQRHEDHGHDCFSGLQVRFGNLTIMVGRTVYNH